MRIGIGYDVHVLTENRRLVLGGVEIPYEKGLLGNSDADVLVHAIMDAMLGAAALGDLGHHFPDDDEPLPAAHHPFSSKNARCTFPDLYKAQLHPVPDSS